MQAGIEAEFWCYSNLSLAEVFEKFRCCFPVNEDDFIHDAENVWEWFDGNTADNGIGFNISRPHECVDDEGLESQPIANEPIRFSLLIHNFEESTGGIGSRLATALGVDVNFGQVVYLNGDEFRFQILETFHAKSGRE